MIDIKLQDIGGMAFTHELLCWFCKEKSAVYSAYPQWCFLPCWDCQKRYKGVWTKKTFWQRLLS